MDEHNETGRQWLIALVIAMALAALFFGIANVTAGEGGDGGFVEGIGWVSWFASVLLAGAVILISVGGLIHLAGWAWERARRAPVRDE